MADSEPYVRPPSAESEGRAPGRGRLAGRRILIVGGGQQVVDAETDPVGNGRAMSILFAREGARIAVADRSRPAAEATCDLIRAEGGAAWRSRPISPARPTWSAWSRRPRPGSAVSTD